MIKLEFKPRQQTPEPRLLSFCQTTSVHLLQLQAPFFPSVESLRECYILTFVFVCNFFAKLSVDSNCAGAFKCTVPRHILYSRRYLWSSEPGFSVEKLLHSCYEMALSFPWNRFIYPFAGREKLETRALWKWFPFLLICPLLIFFSLRYLFLKKTVSL